MISQEKLRELIEEKLRDALIKKFVPHYSLHRANPIEAREVGTQQAQITATKLATMFFKGKQQTKEPERFTPEFLYRLIERSQVYSPQEIEKLARVNMKVAVKWLGWEEKTTHFKIRPCFVPYTESPFGIEVLYEGVRVGTIGGFVDKRNGKHTVVINNLQGVSAETLLDDATRSPLARSKIKTTTDARAVQRLLDQELRPHFRLNLAKRIISASRTKLLARIEGDEPVMGRTKIRENYAERKKRYAQTYYESGLKPPNKGEKAWFLPRKTIKIRKKRN